MAAVGWPAGLRLMKTWRGDDGSNQAWKSPSRTRQWSCCTGYGAWRGLIPPCCEQDDHWSRDWSMMTTWWASYLWPSQLSSDQAIPSGLQLCVISVLQNSARPLSSIASLLALHIMIVFNRSTVSTHCHLHLTSLSLQTDQPVVTSFQKIGSDMLLFLF